MILTIYIVAYFAGIACVIADRKVLKDLEYLGKDLILFSCALVNITLVITGAYIFFGILKVYLELKTRYVLWKAKRVINRVMRKENIPFRIK